MWMSMGEENHTMYGFSEESWQTAAQYFKQSAVW